MGTGFMAGWPEVPRTQLWAWCLRRGQSFRTEPLHWWDMMLTPGRECQKRTELLDTQVVSGESVNWLLVLETPQMWGLLIQLLFEQRRLPW